MTGPTRPKSKLKGYYPIFHNIRIHRKFMFTYLFNFIKLINRPAMYFLFFLGIGILNGFAILVYFAEVDSNARIESYFDAAYFTLSTLSTVGYGDIIPVTVMGKLLVMIMMVVGVAVFLMFTAVITRALFDVEPILKELFHGPSNDPDAKD